MGRRAALIVLASAIGCARSVVPIVIPAHEGTQSFALVLGEAAFFGSTDAPIELDELDGRVELALYAEPASALGLPLGAIDLTVPACLGGCGLITPTAVYTRAALSEDVDWALAPALSEAFLDRLIPDRWPRCSCTRFSDQLVEIPAAQVIRVVSALEEEAGSVLLAVSDGALARLFPDRRVERVCGPWATISEVAASRPGRLWVAQERALSELVLADQRADMPCVAASATTTPEITRDGLFTVGGAEDWAVVVTSVGDALWYDGAFRALGAIGTPSRPYVLRTGPRAALLHHADSDILYFIDDGRMRGERVVANDTIDAITVTPELGLVLALEASGITIQDGRSWRFAQVPGWAAASALHPYRGRLASVEQIVTEITTDLRACPPSPNFSPEPVYRVARLGDDGFVLADIFSSSQRPSAVGVLQPRDWCD